jgi:hypothetical protein
LPDTYNTSLGRDGDGAEHDDAAVVGPPGTTLVRVGEFGPFGALADAAHQRYMEGLLRARVNKR